MYHYHLQKSELLLLYPSNSVLLKLSFCTPALPAALIFLATIRLRVLTYAIISKRAD